MISRRKQMSLQNIFLIFFTIIYSLTYLLDLFFYYKFKESIIPEWTDIRLVMLITFSAMYGAYRAIYCYPYIRKDYRKWLALTPWNVDKPLLLGPVHLALGDLIRIGFLTMLCYFNGTFSLCWPAITFLIPYLLCLFVGFVEEQIGIIVASVFLVPFLIYPHRDPRLTLAVLIIIYSLFYYALKQQFKNFPWNTDFWEFDLVKKLKEQAFNKSLIGWPIDSFAASKKQSCDFCSGVIISLLITWWIYVIHWCLQARVSSGLLLLFSIFISVFRISAYIQNYFSPISLLGRLCTFRFIIPKYDKVFIAPACMILVAVIALFLAPWINHTLLYNSCIFLILLLAFTLPPNREKWQLTAPCRIMPPLKKHRTIQPANEAQAFKKITSDRFSLFQK